MESIRGKHAVCVDPAELVRQMAGYPHVLVDLGTGDGRFVKHIAATCPSTFAIGIDLCAANLREVSRRATANSIYLLGSAYTLPSQLHGVATHLTINFPWSELLTGLLGQEGEARLSTAIAALARDGARLEVRLNAGALAEEGMSLQCAGHIVGRNLQNAGFDIEVTRLLDARELRACPTTWAHRLAFGRDPNALYIRAVKTDRI